MAAKVLFDISLFFGSLVCHGATVVNDETDPNRIIYFYSGYDMTHDER